MLCSLLIPTRLNEGAPVPPDDMKLILVRATEIFGGYTLESNIHGVWLDGKGRKYTDESQRLSLVVPSSRIEVVLRLVQWVGRLLGQETMSLTISGFGMAILPVKPIEEWTK